MHGCTYRLLAHVLIISGAWLTASMAGGDEVFRLPAVVARLPANSAPAFPAWTASRSMIAADDQADLAAQVAELSEEVKKLKKAGASKAKEKLSVKFGGRAYGDFVMWPDQDAASAAAYGNQQNYWEFRRIRFFAEGKGYRVFDYKVQLEFEPEVSGEFSSPGMFGSVGMRDLYIGIHEIPWLGYVRFGNFKEPFGLEEVTSSKYITFMERAMPTTALVPERHLGVCAYNHSAGEQWTIAYGAFFNNSGEKNLAKESVDDDQGIDIPVRLTWNPIYVAEGRGLLHLGVGYVFSEVQNQVLRVRAKPEVHESSTFIDTGDRYVENWHRLNCELACVYGPLSIQSELFYAHTNEIDVPADSFVGFDQDFYGGYVYASWFLTGEHRPYKRTAACFSRVKPLNNFWFACTCNRGLACGSGAWELAVRWSFLELLGPGITDGESGKINDLTLGVNWYWNPHMRMMFNYIHSWGDVLDAAALPGSPIANTDSLGVRMQVDF